MQLLNDSLVSIIIPVYNVKQYLDRCIQSVIMQNYQNLEIILIDDGSTDGSDLICNRYTEKDERIKVIHKENGGLSDARNAGIRVANGKYIAFIDADDYVHKEFIEMLTRCLEQNEADIVICGYIKGKENDFPKRKKGNNKCVIFHSKEMLLQWHSKYKHVETVAWNKLYVKELFTSGHILFPYGCNNEDVQTTHLLIAASEKVCVLNRKLYYYFQRSGSITNGTLSNKSIHDNIISQNKRLEFFAENGYTGAYERLKIKRLKYYMLAYCAADHSDIRNMMMDHYKSEYKEILRFRHTKAYEKILIILFTYFYKIICRIYKLVK